MTAILVPEGHNADKVRAAILERYDLSLGAGLGKVAGKVFRIGHLGWMNDLMLIGTLGGVEMGLAAAGVPHKKGGVAAAMDYLGGNIGAAERGRRRRNERRRARRRGSRRRGARAVALPRSTRHSCRGATTTPTQCRKRRSSSSARAMPGGRWEAPTPPPRSWPRRSSQPWSSRARRRFTAREDDFRAVEAELALSFARDVPANASADEVWAAVGGVHVAIELLATRYADRDAMPPAALLADMQNNGGFCYGPANPVAAVDFLSARASLLIDGREAKTRGRRQSRGPSKAPPRLARAARGESREAAAGRRYRYHRQPHRPHRRALGRTGRRTIRGAGRGGAGACAGVTRSGRDNDSLISLRPVLMRCSRLSRCAVAAMVPKIF